MMKWLSSLFKRNTAPRDDELIDRYKDTRKSSVQLNMALAKQVPKPAVPECGKKLGLYKAGTLILNNDDEIAILYDYCLHHYRRADKTTVIDRHIEQTPPEPGSTEALLLDAMLQSRYSLFRVEAVRHRQGAVLRDLLSGDTVEIIDIALSDTAEPGLIVAGRLLAMPGFTMSSGTLVPVPEAVYEDKILPVIRKYVPEAESGAHARFSEAQRASFVAQVIRIALREGGEDNVFYTDVEH